MNTKKKLVLGMLATMGLAGGLQAACPPEDCAAGKAGGEATAHVLLERLPDAPRLAENRLAPLTLSLVRPDANGLVELRADNVQRLNPIALSLVRPDGANVVELRAETINGPLALSQAQPDSRARVLNVRPDKEKSKQERVIVNDNETITLSMEDGKILRLERNGKKIPADRVKKEGDQVVIMDESGKVLQKFSVGSGGANVVVGDSDEVYEVRGMMAAEPPSVMIGVQLGEPNAMLLGHFGLDAGEATLITGVYDGLPAGEAGLQPYDIIIAVDGNKPAGQNEVREAIRAKGAGDDVKLTVIHRGEKKDIKVSLVKYDGESLEKSKLNAIEADVLTFNSAGMTTVPGGRVFVAPELGPMSGQGMDANRARAFAEQWRQQAEELAQKFKLDQGQGVLEYRLDTKPAPAPDAPAAPAPRAGGEHWQRLEERLERLEKMIERLAERQGERNRGGR